MRQGHQEDLRKKKKLGSNQNGMAGGKNTVRQRPVTNEKGRLVEGERWKLDREEEKRWNQTKRKKRPG